MQSLRPYSHDGTPSLFLVHVSSSAPLRAKLRTWCYPIEQTTWRRSTADIWGIRQRQNSCLGDAELENGRLSGAAFYTVVQETTLLTQTHVTTKFPVSFCRFNPTVPADQLDIGHVRLIKPSAPKIPPLEMVLMWCGQRCCPGLTWKLISLPLGTDEDTLKWILNSTSSLGKRARWGLCLSELDFDVVHYSAIT